MTARYTVDPNGPVVIGVIDEFLHLPHPRMAWHRAAIELHRHTDGLWMWSTNYCLDSGSGGGYRVGPKWGKFAATRDDALGCAIAELRERLGATDDRDARGIVVWLDGLDPDQGDLFSGLAA